MLKLSDENCIFTPYCWYRINEYLRYFSICLHPDVLNSTKILGDGIRKNILKIEY